MIQESISPNITLDEIVNSYLDQYLMPQSKYRRIYGIAIRGYRLLFRDATGYPKTVKLPILANNTSVLPTDALNKISIGYLNNRGEIASLIYDPLLSFIESENTGRLSQSTDNTIPTDQELLFSLQDSGNLGFVGYGGFGQYGIGSQPITGFYNIDWKHRVIVYGFSNTQVNEVIFEYLGFPDNNGEYIIHPFFQETLISFINWQDSKGNPKSSKSEREENKRDFDLQYKNAMRALNPFDPSDLYNQWRQTQRISPKT